MIRSPAERSATRSIHEKGGSRGPEKRFAVLRVSACGYQETTSVTTLANTQGLEATRRSTLGLITLSVIASNGKEQTNGFSWRAIKDLDEDQAAEFVEEAVREAVNKLDAVSIPSGSYRTILRYDVATDLLASLWAMFSAEQIQKDLSILKDRQGESIMSPLITIGRRTAAAGWLFQL